MAQVSSNAFVPGLELDDLSSPCALARAGFTVVAVLGLALAAWGALAPINGAVIAAGQVKVDMNRKTVQHQEGGIVREILVRDGMKVDAGQTLVILDDVRVDAGREALRTQLDAELAKAARLQAEQSFEAAIRFPDELTRRADDPRVQDLVRRETALFRARSDALNSQLTRVQEQIKETHIEVRARAAQLGASGVVTRFQDEELRANQALVERGFVSKMRVLALQREVAGQDARRMESEAELSRARQRISELELRADTLRSNFMQEAATALRQTTAQMFDLRERLRPLDDAGERQRITAPIAGEVVDLRFTTVGAVIGPRDAVLDIVPTNADLIVESRVRPEDIDSVVVGAEADVRLTAFKSRITPTVMGLVTYVSADRLTDKASGAPYYVAQVRVSPEALRDAGGLRLQAGMPAETFIKTAPRSAVTYLLEPLTGFLQRSLREP